MTFFTKITIMILASLALGSLAIATAEQNRALASEPFKCKSAKSCGQCVNPGCSWSGGACFDSCRAGPADARCYNYQNFPGMKSNAICTLERENKCKGFGTNCQGCLSNGCKFDGAKCMSSCIMDAPCFQLGTFAGLNVASTCRRIGTGGWRKQAEPDASAPEAPENDESKKSGSVRGAASGPQNHKGMFDWFTFP